MGVVVEDPGNGGEWAGVGVEGMAVYCLESSDDKEQDHHGEGTEEEGWATPPLVQVDDCRECQGDVEDVLDRRGEKSIADS